MEQEHKKILQIAGGFRSNVNGKPISGGVASFLYNYYTHMDNDFYLFDFMAIRNQCFELYRDDLEKMGSSLYCLDLQNNGLKRAILLVIKLRRFLVENKYDAVHINMGSFFPVLCCAFASKIAGVNVVVAHSHSAGMYSKKKRFFANLFSPFLTLFTDKCCACSLIAAENMFSKKLIHKGKITFIKNAIDTNKFKYDENSRTEYRKKLGINNEFIIGHVGRFVEVKNHDFLLHVFQKIKNEINNTKLLLVGDGELRKDIELKAQKLGIHDSVLFIGQIKNTSPYYQVMDAFVLPSIVEGYPVVALEAQCSGVQCYISSNVTREIKLSELCQYVSLKDGEDAFAKLIIENRNILNKRKDMSDVVKDAGLDLKTNIKIFESLYDYEN